MSRLTGKLIERGYYKRGEFHGGPVQMYSPMSYDGDDGISKSFFPGPGGAGFLGEIPEFAAYPYQALESHYKSNPWVFRSVDVISNSIATLPLKLYRERVVGGKPKREEVVTHDALTLLARPNPMTSGRDHKKALAANAVLNGEAWQYTEDGTSGLGAAVRKPISMRVVKPYHIAPIPHPLQMISGYLYMQNSIGIKIQPPYIAGVKTWNPDSDYRGLPPMQVAKDSSLLQYYMRKYNRKFFQNGTFFGLYMFTDKVLQDPTREKILEQIKQEYGGLDNVNKLPLFHGGFQVGNASTNAKDGEFIGIGKWSREETLTVYGVPPVAVGVLDFANYANTWQQMKMFYELTVLPWCEMLSDALTHGWLRIFWPEQDDLYLAFDYSNIKFLGEEAEAKSRIDQGNVREGMITINEWRAENQLPPVDWGDDAPATFSGSLGLSAAPPAVSQKRLWICKSSYDVRRARWAEINRRVEADMPLYSKMMIKHWSGQLQRIKSKLRGYAASGIGVADISKAYPNAEDLFDADYEAKTLQALALPILNKVIARVGKQALLDIKSDVTFNVLDPNVVTFIQNKAFHMAGDVTRNTQKAIRRIIIDGITSQSTIDQIAERITSTYDDFERYRALRVARTEAGGAHTGGAIEAYDQGGVGGKGWASIIDDATRESHVAIDGEEVGLREEFSNGLQGPCVAGSGGFDPEEEINCRCAMYAVV